MKTYFALIIFIFCYIGAAGGALLFWLIGLGLVVTRILKSGALPGMALVGAVIGVLVIIAVIIGRNDYSYRQG
jgi:hypothetical protein